MMNDKFYELMYRLEYIIRYSNVPRMHDESVASHSFFVCAVLMDLYDHYEFDIGRALQIAIAHDMPEARTNDISHETKRLFPEIRQVLDKAEYQSALELPLAAQEGFYEYKMNDTPEALFVHLADSIQCNQYTAHEISLGNSGYMKEVYDNTCVRINEMFRDVELYRRKERLKRYEYDLKD